MQSADPTPMLAPGPINRSAKLEAQPPAFTMTAEHLARTMEGARKRERARIAQYLDDAADLAASEAEHEAARRFREAAEYVRSFSAPLLATARVQPDEVQPDEVVRDTSLPPVVHQDDFEQGIALVRNLALRGRAFGG